MKKSVSKEANRNNLFYFVSIIGDLDYFPFHGTLLGLVRDGDVIDGDDDVDIFVNMKDREIFFDILQKSEFNIDLNNDLNQCSPYFIQLTRETNGAEGIVDVHFFIEESGYIVDWQSAYAWETGNNPFKVLSSLIYPLQTGLINNLEIKLPRYPIGCCRVIYGKSWRIPRKKYIDYTQTVNGGITNEIVPTRTKIMRYINRSIMSLFK